MRWFTCLFLSMAFLASYSSVGDAHGGTITGVIKSSPRKYRKHVIVYIKNLQYKKAVKGKAVLDQQNMQFKPFFLIVRPGTTVKFLNSDSVRHNVFSPDNEKYNLGTFGNGKHKNYTFNKCKKVLCSYVQLCNVHAEMEAYVVVLRSKKYAKTNRRGAFKLTNVPPGKYTLTTWSPKLRSKSIQVVVKKGKTTKVKFRLRKK